SVHGPPNQVSSPLARPSATSPARLQSVPRGVTSRSCSYGFVVDSVNVSVLLYVPLRSGSLLPIDCLNSIVTGSLDTGARQVNRFSGDALEPMLLNAVPVVSAFVARACSGCGR